MRRAGDLNRSFKYTGGEIERTMMTRLENAYLTVQISELGAELTGIYDKERGHETIWQANPEFWDRHAPILFPFVGKVNGGYYRYKGRKYPMGQHGFARDLMFTLIRCTDTSATYDLVSNEKTREVYPMDFDLRITYILDDNVLTVQWDVFNPSSDEPLYFSIGGHPGFNVPILPGTVKNDYFVLFEQEGMGGEEFEPASHLRYILIDPETAGADADNVRMLDLSGGRRRDTEDGRVVPQLAPGMLKLTEHMFDNDALIFDGSQITRASILYPDRTPYVRLTCRDFPSFGLWSKSAKAPFVCLEPWIGRVDNKGFDGELKDRFEEQKLDPLGHFHREYSIEID